MKSKNAKIWSWKQLQKKTKKKLIEYLLLSCKSVSFFYLPVHKINNYLSSMWCMVSLDCDYCVYIMFCVLKPLKISEYTLPVLKSGVSKMFLMSLMFTKAAFVNLKQLFSKYILKCIYSCDARLNFSSPCSSIPLSHDPSEIILICGLQSYFCENCNTFLNEGFFDVQKVQKFKTQIWNVNLL